jgi:hypothetical protein
MSFRIFLLILRGAALTLAVMILLALAQPYVLRILGATNAPLARMIYNAVVFGVMFRSSDLRFAYRSQNCRMQSVKSL